ncbi:helix-turn-helix transcriptional regulator [Paenibacillus sp. FSL R10-2734]|uniref:helix-turn-helix domain-containing protein n=1 Tax=Paenibacillus sp. FSL R10-2734 TaxID=2954691 RepID=UPI0030D888B2
MEYTANPVIRNIEATRKKKGFTMKQIADHCGRSVPWYADIAKGRRRVYLEDMLLIAESMNEHPKNFFTKKLSETHSSNKSA